MEQFSWIDHGYEYLVLNSEELLEDVHLFVDKDVLEQDYVVAMLAKVWFVEFLHLVYVYLASMLD